MYKIKKFALKVLYQILNLLPIISQFDKNLKKLIDDLN